METPPFPLLLSVYLVWSGSPVRIKPDPLILHAATTRYSSWPLSAPDSFYNSHMENQCKVNRSTVFLFTYCISIFMNTPAYICVSVCSDVVVKILTVDHKRQCLPDLLAAEAGGLPKTSAHMPRCFWRAWQPLSHVAAGIQ